MKGFIIITGAIIAFVIYAAIIHYLFDRIFEELKKKQQDKLEE